MKLLLELPNFFEREEARWRDAVRLCFSPQRQQIPPNLRLNALPAASRSLKSYSYFLLLILKAEEADRHYNEKEQELLELHEQRQQEALITATHVNHEAAAISEVGVLVTALPLPRLTLPWLPLSCVTITMVNIVYTLPLPRLSVFMCYRCHCSCVAVAMVAIIMWYCYHG